MGTSLQEQLLKAGLVGKQKAKDITAEKRKKAKQQRSGKQRPVAPDKLRGRRAHDDKVARDRELNQQRDKEAKRKAIAAQIRQLIEGNRLRRDEGDVPYNFAHQSRLKKIYVTREIRQGLSSGKLAIARIDDRYDVVPAAVAEKIRARDEDCVVQLPQQNPSDDADDYYADYKVPDDMTW